MNQHFRTVALSALLLSVAATGALAGVDGAASLPPPVSDDGTVPVDPGPLNPITDLAIIDYSVGGGTLTAQWTEPLDAYKYWFAWSSSGPITDANWGSATAFAANPSPGSGGVVSHAFNITLTEGDEVWIAMTYGNDSYAVSTVSNSPSITPDGTGPTTVTDLSLVPNTLGSSSASVTCTVPPDMLAGAPQPATSAEISWVANPGPTPDFSAGTIVPVGGIPGTGQALTVNLQSLPSGTTIAVSIRFLDGLPQQNAGAWSPALVITTLAGATSGSGASDGGSSGGCGGSAAGSASLLLLLTAAVLSSIVNRQS